MVVQLIESTSRKAQFFIITAVLVGGSLGIIATTLENYNDFAFNEVSSVSSPTQFQTIANSVDSLWYEEAWSYEREFLIQEQSDHRLDSFPVQLTLNTQQLISDGKMQADCADLRVVIDDVSVPYQIKDGTCNTEETEIWVLASLDADGTKQGSLYYGNEEVSDTSFRSPFTIDTEEQLVENEIFRIKANDTDDHGLGLTEIFLTGTADHLVDDGVALFNGNTMASWSEMKIADRGPIYTTVSLGPNHNFTMFADNAFLRREGGFSMTDGDTLFYSTEDQPLDQWEAADGATASVNNGPFSGTFQDDTDPYITAYSSSDDLSLTMTTNTSVDQYRAESGATYEMGLAGDTPVTRVDYLIDNERPASFQAAIHADPPLTTVGSETQGTFYPMNGWQYKASVRIEETAGRALDRYPVDVFLRLGQFDVRDDCQDIVVINDEQRIPHEIIGECNSGGFDQPDDHTVRWPLDEGGGSQVNGTEDLFTGSTQGDPAWTPGRFSFGLTFDGDDSVLIDDGPVIALDRSPYTISFWMRPTATQEGSLFKLPQESPEVRITNQGGSYRIQGIYTNETGNRFTVASNTELSTLTNTWHHIAFRHDQDAQTISLFIDGTEEASTNVQGRMRQTNEDITFGDAYTGALDEIKLYKRALTDETIRDQQDLLTQLRMPVNVTPATTQYVDIYMGSSTIFETPAPTYVDDSPAEDPRVESTTVIQQEDGWNRLQSHLNGQQSIAGTIGLERNGQCSDLSFDTRRFFLEKTIC